MYKLINESLFFPSGEMFILLTVSLGLFIVFIWWFMTSLKKDNKVEYFCWFIVLIYGIFVFYPYMQNLTESTELIKITSTKSSLISENDVLVMLFTFVIFFISLLFVRGFIDRFYKIYARPTYKFILIRKKIIDLLFWGINNILTQKDVLQEQIKPSNSINLIKNKLLFVIYKLIKNLPQNEEGYKTKKENKTPKIWYSFKLVFYCLLLIFVYDMFIDTNINNYRLHNLFYVVLWIILFKNVFDRIGSILMSNLGKIYWYHKIFGIRFQESKNLSNNKDNILINTLKRNIYPLYTWPIKIMGVFTSFLFLWFFHKTWMVFIGFFVDYDIISLVFSQNNPGFFGYILKITKISFILWGFYIVITKYIIPDTHVIDKDHKKQVIISPFAKHNHKHGILEYCSYEHSSNSVLAIFGWIIASIGIFYPVVLGIFMFFMIFRSYSAIDLNNLSNPKEKENKKTYELDMLATA